MGFKEGPRTFDPIKRIKKCVKCNIWLEFSNFWIDKHNTTGLVSKCKSCYRKFKQTNEYKEYRKAYEQTEKYKKYHKEYEATRRIRTEKDSESRRKRETKYRKEDPLYKLKQNTNRRIRYALTNKRLNKQLKTIDYLGCSIDELKNHLEKQFKPGMTWDNYGQWEIDHRIPLSSANNEQEMIKLFHYTNLQPLWSKDNRKKSDKLNVEYI